MTEAHTQSDNAAHADRSAGSAKRNDLATEGERRSFREETMNAGAAASKGAMAFEQARRMLGAGGSAEGYWGPNLLSRQLVPLLRIQTDMIRWFDDMWREGAVAWWPNQRFGAPSAAPLFGLPTADVKETDAAYKLSVELPGLTREDVHLALEGDVLLVSGHKQEERQEAGAAYRLSERRFGRFERSFQLPPDVNRDAVGAAFKDGVLAITLPKRGQVQAAKRAQVEIRG